MELRNIIVIGASAGGFDALKKLTGALPANLQASIFIVWHMSSNIRGVLPQVLNRENTIHAAHAFEGESIKPNRIYVAPPDRHLLIEEGRVHLTCGPKEHRFRPAVDPLFRSAAYTYGSRVIGVILSGALDDGSSGLWTIKYHGGLAVVQDPLDAEVPSMPENAMRAVAVDYSVPISEMGDLLVRLSTEQTSEITEKAVMEKAKKQDEKTKIEIRIAAEENALELGIMNFGKLSPYTCPDCHGVLSSFNDGNLIRFRCHTGHAYSAESLLATISECIEDSMWSSIRSLEEIVMLLNYMGDNFAEGNESKLAGMYFKKAQEAIERSKIIRQSVMQNEQLSNDSLRLQTVETNSVE